MKQTGRVAMIVCLAFPSFALQALPAAAQSVMQQCGQQYQAAKANNTLGGQTWNQFRTACAARLKAEPAPAEAAPEPAAAAAPAANPLKPAPASTTAPAAAPAPAPASTASAPAAGSAPAKAAPSAGRVAFVARERQCGAEWKANKASLTAQTPGLKWPKYLSQCNARLKAAGQ